MRKSSARPSDVRAPEQKKAFLALADLEVASADQVDAALGVNSTGDL